MIPALDGRNMLVLMTGGHGMPAKEQSVESNITCGAEFSFWSLKVSRNRDIPPRKLTWQWNIPPFKDVFHIEHEDFAIAMLVFGGVYI